MGAIVSSLSTLPAYLSFVGLMLLLLAGFFRLYTWFTPYDELALIRRGNAAAAVSLGGALIGFSLPLSSVAAHTSSVVELLIWGLVALVSQGAVYLVVARLILRDVQAGIEEGRMSYGILLASFSLAVGTLNYGSLTY